MEQNLDLLRQDLVAEPMRIAAHSDMPFAIFRYSPEEEFQLRKRLRLLAYSLSENHGRKVAFLSISRLVWGIVRRFEGTDYLFKTESIRGFQAAEEHINRLLSSEDYRPIADEVLERIKGFDHDRDIVFLVRAGGFAPFIYRCSSLLDGLHRRTKVPVILFYPGSAEAGTDLKFFDLPSEANLGVYNYRVKIYGVDK
ncbi:DUF1788 domain-containing protein [Geobacter sulfurreducens]|uniref:DUF1788 domain-containing protein n=1 Tax=Geobacter sulfurreducens TaxID=35554 RepID=UPI0013E8C8F8|nr:DUF1788 domain-containing protein [Geobacter sulfurreducens]UAC02835.1 DUF1788 domain-containing protein [Geobacter sulfurreducens]